MNRIHAFLLACTILFVGVLIVPANVLLLGSMAPCPGPCPPGVNCKIKIVYVYMINDPEAGKSDRAWLGTDALGLVQWTTQTKGWVTTRRAEAEQKRATLLSPRGRRATIRKFFLMESNKQ